MDECLIFSLFLEKCVFFSFLLLTSTMLMDVLACSSFSKDFRNEVKAQSSLEKVHHTQKI